MFRVPKPVEGSGMYKPRDGGALCGWNTPLGRRQCMCAASDKRRSLPVSLTIMDSAALIARAELVES